jgi:hypothetical protein
VFGDLGAAGNTIESTSNYVELKCTKYQIDIE